MLLERDYIIVETYEMLGRITITLSAEGAV